MVLTVRVWRRKEVEGVGGNTSKAPPTRVSSSITHTIHTHMLLSVPKITQPARYLCGEILGEIEISFPFFPDKTLEP